MQHHCLHCNNPIPLSTQSSFCCFGCNTAYSFINKLKLDKYYEYCRNIYYKNPMKVNEIENNLDYLEHVTTRENQSHQIVLLIDGIHCGACIWLIENTLNKQTTIKNARLNLSTNRLTIEWNGKKNLINEFVKIVEKLGYKATPFSADQMLVKSLEQQKELLKRLVVSGAVSAQIMMLSVAIWAGNIQTSMGEYMRLMLHLFIAIITIPAVIYSGMPFFKSALTALKNKHSNMDVPISVGTITATIISIQETFHHSDYTYYDAAISLIFILLIGRYLDLKVRNQANEAAHKLILNQPVSVTIFEDNKYKLINIKKALAGQIALVTIGERIPVDGIIIEGNSEIDNSIINGETIPLKVSVGDNVFAGSINLSGILKIKITKTADNTTLNEIIKLIENAKQIKSQYINIADKIASFYTPVVFTTAIFTFILWYYFFCIPITKALLYAISVLIITCPCALGLAVPIVQVVAVLKLMKNGILVKSQNTLEKLTSITDIIFDKTGTITYGTPQWLNKDEFNDELLQIIASVARYSKHPIMKAVINATSDNNFLDVKVTEHQGMGLTALVNQMEVKIGNRILCNIQDEEHNDHYLETWFKYGNTVKRLIFEDKIRAEAKDVIQNLKEHDYKLSLLSGDRNEVVAKIASQVKIEKFAGLLRPEDKYNMIKQMQKDGKKVLMIGDGLNDSPALQIADVSLSPSTAIAISSSNSDIVFQQDLYSILICLSTAKKSIKLIKQNFLLSFIYNVLTVPIAVIGLITPLIAAIAMASSSIIVVLNAIRLNLNHKK